MVPFTAEQQHTSHAFHCYCSFPQEHIFLFWVPHGFCSPSATRWGGEELSPWSTSLPPQGRQHSLELPGWGSKGGNIHHFCIWEPPSVCLLCPAAVKHSSVQLSPAGSGAEPGKVGFGSWFHVRYFLVPPESIKIGNQILAKIGFSLMSSHYVLHTLQQGASPVPSDTYKVFLINWHLPQKIQIIFRQKNSTLWSWKWNKEHLQVAS